MDISNVSKISSAGITLPLQKKYSLTQEHAKKLRAKHWKIFLPTEISSGYLRTKSKYQRNKEKPKSNFKAKNQLIFPKEIRTNKQPHSSKKLSPHGNGKKPFNTKQNFVVEKVDLCNYIIKFVEATKQNHKHNRTDKTKPNEFKIKHKTYSELQITLSKPTLNHNIQQCYCINNYENVKQEALQSVLSGNSSGSLLSMYSLCENFGRPIYNNEIHPDPHNCTTYQIGRAITNWNSQGNKDEYFHNFPAPHRFTWLNPYEEDWKLNYYYKTVRRHYQWATPGRNCYFNVGNLSNFNSRCDFAFNSWHLSKQHY